MNNGKRNWVFQFPDGYTKKYYQLTLEELADKAYNNKHNLCQKCKENKCFEYKTLSQGKFNRFPKVKFRKNGTIFISCVGRVCNDCHRRINWNSQDFKKVTDKQRKARVQNMTTVTNNYESQAKSKLNFELNRCRNKHITRLQLYYALIAESDEYIKIGIAQDMYKRLNHPKRTITYISIHQLKKGGFKKIATLEYEIKIRFCIRDNELSSELIKKSDLPKVKRFIAQYCKR